jgi:protein TonB
MEMPTMDLPMDLPKTKPLDMPALRVEGTVQMNSELKDYLARLQILLRGNFNPPAGETIAKGTKSSIAFTISRSGQISAVSLRASSGNGIWDRLAVRAVTITKAPPLPPSFLQEQLVMVYDFREK